MSEDRYWWQDMEPEEFDRRMTEIFEFYYWHRLATDIQHELGCPDKLEPYNRDKETQAEFIARARKYLTVSRGDLYNIRLPEKRYTKDYWDEEMKKLLREGSVDPDKEDNDG